MRWIIEPSLKFGMLVVALAAGILVLGISQLRGIPVDMLPEFATPYVEVQTEALGLSAQEVEQLVTVPLEQDLLDGVPWLKEIRSESLPGLSSVVMTFYPGTDPLRARQVVGERLTQAFALPHVSRPPTMLQPKSAASRVMMVGLSSRDLSLIDLSVLARWTIAPRLMGVPGVASVSIWGQRDRQLQVQVDPRRLQANNVTLLQILETTGNAMWVSSLSFVEASTPGTGGFIETANQRLGIRHVFPISSPEGLAQVPLEGAPALRLGDVANVVEDHQPLIGDAADGGPSLLLVVEKSPSANTLEVTEGLDKAIAAMRPGLSGVDVDSSIYRPAGFIDMAIGDFGKALLAGGILVILVLGLLLRDWRAVAISAVSIPVSLTAGLLVLYFRGASLNAVVVAGFLVALGVVIDDAIVDVHSMLRRLRKRGTGAHEGALNIVLESAIHMRSAILYAAVILVLAVVPAWLLGGLTGAFLQPLVISYGLAIVASLVVALTLTPALSLILLQHIRTERNESGPVRWLRRIYGRILTRSLRAPSVSLLTVPAIAAIGIALVPFVHLSMVPAFKEPELLIHLDGAPGTSRSEMDRIVSRIGEELRTVQGVRNVGAHVGRALLSDRVVNVNSSELWVSVDPGPGYDTTVEGVRRVIDGYPGLHREVHTYLQDRTAAFGGESAALTVRVFGENPRTLRRAAEDVQATLNGIDGLTAQHLDLPVEQPTLEVAVDLAVAQRYGLKPGDVRRAAATLLSGIQAGSLFEDQKVFDVVVSGTPETRSSLSSIRDLMLDTPAGGHVRLGDVAHVNVVPAQSVIRHTDVRSYIDDKLEVRGRSAGAVADEVQRRLQQTQLPLEYHAELVGNYAAQDAAQSRFLLGAAAVALSIFLLLQAAFGSWRFAMFAAALLPSAVVGGLVAVVASGGALTIGALAGLLAVFGIAVRNLIVLVRRCQQLERDEGVTLSGRLIVRVAHERVGAVLATTVAMGAAMLPFIVAGAAPGFEVARPLALVVIGGLMTSTLLTLFVVPAGYLVFAMPRGRVAAAHPRGISMKHVYQWLISVLCLATVLVAGCCPVASAQETPSTRLEAVRVEPIEGSDVSRVTLTSEAAKRLDIQVAAVDTMDVGNVQRTVVPYAALIYDLDGGVWAYTSPEPLTFVREKLDVDTIQGDLAVVSAGPPTGTKVVTVGAAELYGAEFEFQEG